MNKKNKKSAPPEIRINVRVPREEKDRLTSIAEQTGIRAATIVREGVKLKVNELAAKLRECKQGEVVTI